MRSQLLTWEEAVYVDLKVKLEIANTTHISQLVPPRYLLPVANSKR